MCLQCVCNSKQIASNFLDEWSLQISTVDSEIWPKGKLALVSYNDPDIIFNCDILDGEIFEQLNSDEDDVEEEIEDSLFQKYILYLDALKDLNITIMKCNSPLLIYTLINKVKTLYKIKNFKNNIEFAHYLMKSLYGKYSNETLYI